MDQKHGLHLHKMQIGSFPRHAKAYTNLKKMKDEIEIERVRALKAFIKDSLEGKFPGPENSVNVSEEILENFKKKL